jgi:hypothetical protein
MYFPAAQLSPLNPHPRQTQETTRESKPKCKQGFAFKSPYCVANRGNDLEANCDFSAKARHTAQMEIFVSDFSYPWYGFA